MYIGEAMPLIPAQSLRRVGMRSRSAGTMVRWLSSTAGTCVKLSDRRQSRPRCKAANPRAQEASDMPERVDVKPGEEWLVVTCHNHSCARRILIDPVGPEMRDDEGDLIFPADTVLVICRHCELESLYQSERNSM